MKVQEDLRRRVLDASLALIASEGLEAFSMREVARRAGVSHQAPYHHFPDREAIMAAIVAEGFGLLRAEAIGARDGGGDAFTRLSAIGRAYFNFALTYPAHFKLMFRSEWVQAERHEAARECAQGAFGVLASAIADVSDVLGRPSDPTLLIMAWSLAHGLAALMLEGKLEMPFGPDKGAQHAAAESALERFAAMVRAEAPSISGS